MAPYPFPIDDSELKLEWVARSVNVRHIENACDQSAPVGVLMLDTAFKRYPRDIGCPDSLPFATLQRRVESAVVDAVVTRDELPPQLFEGFARAGNALIKHGASVITTSCGFLHSVQAELAASLSVPVVASSLLVLPTLQKLAGETQHAGVLTFDERALDTRAICEQGGVYPTPHIVGIAPDSHFADVIHERSPPDVSLLEQDVETAAIRLAAQRPAFVILECTNLAPWRAVVERVCKVPVVDLVDVVCWALQRQRRA